MSKLSKAILIICLFFINSINSIKIKNEKNALNSKYLFSLNKNNKKKNNYPDDYLNIIASHKQDKSADRIEPDHTFNETLSDIINRFVADTKEEENNQQVDTQTSQNSIEETKPFLETITDNNGKNQQEQAQQQQAQQQQAQQQQAQQQKAQQPQQQVPQQPQQQVQQEKQPQ